MNATFFHSLHAEWLKQRRSLAGWMVIAGACFVPLLVLAVRLVRHHELPALYQRQDFWPSLWTSMWESAALFFLPMGAVLCTSLLTQIEYRSNAWKQVHVLPLSPAVIYFSKLAIALALVAGFFVVFNLAIWLSAALPAALFVAVPYPPGPLPVRRFLQENLHYFIDCLPIVALQFAICLRFRNFLVPIGVGFLLWVMTLGALPWRWAFLLPYSYTSLNYLANETATRAARPLADIHALAFGYFLLFVLLGWWLFASRREKG